MTPVDAYIRGYGDRYNDIDYQGYDNDEPLDNEFEGYSIYDTCDDE